MSADKISKIEKALKSKTLPENTRKSLEKSLKKLKGSETAKKVNEFKKKKVVKKVKKDENVSFGGEMNHYALVETWNGEGYSENNLILEQHEYRTKQRMVDILEEKILNIPDNLGVSQDEIDIEFDKEKLVVYYNEQESDDSGSLQAIKLKESDYAVLFLTSINEVKTLSKSEYDSLIKDFENIAYNNLNLSDKADLEEYENGEGRHFFDTEFLEYFKNNPYEESDIQLEVLKPKGVPNKLRKDLISEFKKGEFYKDKTIPDVVYEFVKVKDDKNLLFNSYLNVSKNNPSFEKSKIQITKSKSYAKEYFKPFDIEAQKYFMQNFTSERGEQTFITRATDKKEFKKAFNTFMGATDKLIGEPKVAEKEVYKDEILVGAKVLRRNKTDQFDTKDYYIIPALNINAPEDAMGDFEKKYFEKGKVFDITDKLELGETDGVEFEEWEDKKTGEVWSIPIEREGEEITRYTEDAQLIKKSKPKVSKKKPKAQTSKTDSELTEYLKDCKKALNSANFKVSKIKTKSGTKTVKRKVRSDNAILNTKMKSVSKTILKDIDEKKSPEIYKQAQEIISILSEITKKIDKLVSSKKVNELETIKKFFDKF